MRAGVHWSNQLQDGPYRLFAQRREDGTRPWDKRLAIQVRAMLLAGKVLFVAGPNAELTGWGEGRGAKLLAISAADGWGDVWTMSPDGTAKTRLAGSDGKADYFPSWSPDGREIVFCSGTSHSPREGRWTLHILDVATGRVRPLFSGAERALFPDWR